MAAVVTVAATAGCEVPAATPPSDADNAVDVVAQATDYPPLTAYP